MKNLIKRACFILALLFACVILSAFPKLVANCYLSYTHQRRSLPTEGTFFCQENSLSLTFEQDTVLILYPDGSEEYVDIDYAAKMFVKRTGVIFRYEWNDKQQIILVVEKGNTIFTQGESYCFEYEE